MPWIHSVRIQDSAGSFRYRRSSDGHRMAGRCTADCHMLEEATLDFAVVANRRMGFGRSQDGCHNLLRPVVAVRPVDSAGLQERSRRCMHRRLDYHSLHLFELVLALSLYILRSCRRGRQGPTGRRQRNRARLRVRPQSLGVWERQKEPDRPG